MASSPILWQRQERGAQRGLYTRVDQHLSLWVGVERGRKYVVHVFVNGVAVGVCPLRLSPLATEQDAMQASLGVAVRCLVEMTTKTLDRVQGELTHDQKKVAAAYRRCARQWQGGSGR
jgi:hypothetical protein